jgi:hypothetical protein
VFYYLKNPDIASDELITIMLGLYLDLPGLDT